MQIEVLPSPQNVFNQNRKKMTPEQFFDEVEAMGLTQDQVLSCMKAYRDKGAEGASALARKFKDENHRANCALKEWTGKEGGEA